MRIILSPNPYRDKNLNTLRQANQILHEIGAETVVCLPFSLSSGSKMDFPGDIAFSNFEEELPRADLLICFGGDGTILHAAKRANQYQLPVLGVNVGSVGFMADIEHSALEELRRLEEPKGMTLESRMMIEARVLRRGKVVFEDTALNDAVITKGAVAREIDLSVYSEHQLITSFSGDGLVVATPTGSTAYSLSAGGPIIEPTARSMVLTPICAHALWAKSFVFDSSRVLTVLPPQRQNKSAFLSVDGGKAFKMAPTDKLILSKAKQVTQFARLGKRNFYQRLNQKLGGHPYEA